MLYKQVLTYIVPVITDLCSIFQINSVSWYCSIRTVAPDYIVKIVHTTSTMGKRPEDKAINPQTMSQSLIPIRSTLQVGNQSQISA